MTLVSALTAAITELQADAGVAALTTRIRPIEPLGRAGTDPGDALGPGQYRRFVVVSVQDAPPIPHTGVRDVSLGLRCYGVTYLDAETLWYACEAVFRDKGARLGAGRIGIYHSAISGGPNFDKDPSTSQPYAYGIVSYPVTIAAVPA